MANLIKKGSTVRLKAPVIEGPILDQKIIDDSIQYLVEYEAIDGSIAQRWFREDQLEVVE